MDGRTGSVVTLLGDWSGQFRITGCSGGFDFRECGRMMVGAGAGTGTGTAPSPFYPFTLQLSQSSRSR